MKVIIHSGDRFSWSLLRGSAGGKRVRPSCIGSSGAAGGGTLGVSDWDLSTRLSQSLISMRVAGKVRVRVRPGHWG